MGVYRGLKLRELQGCGLQGCAVWGLHCYRGVRGAEVTERYSVCMGLKRGAGSGGYRDVQCVHGVRGVHGAGVT